MKQERVIEHLSALPVGSELGDYGIERVLGVGAFGITYLATDSGSSRRVAIKEYMPTDLAVRDGASTTEVAPISAREKADFRWGLGRFLDEAEVLRRFLHPNIVKVMGRFRANGTAYIVMEYLKGETLAQALETRKTLSENELGVLLMPILDALEQVHRTDYLHRDLKPGNIILKRDGQPVILDFGSARQALSARSRSVTSLVTPGYAPMEQYSSRGNQGPWTDIYALGAIAFRALTGSRPIPGPERVLEDALEGWTLGVTGASPNFLWAIDQALRLKADDRPQSIGEWKRMLGYAEQLDPKPAQAVAPVSGKPHGAPQRSTVFLAQIFQAGGRAGATLRSVGERALRIIREVRARAPSAGMGLHRPSVVTGVAGAVILLAGIAVLVVWLNPLVPNARREGASATTGSGTGFQQERGNFASQELIADIQQELLRLGYERIVPNGVFGKETRDAIRTFQRRIGIVGEARVTPMLLRQLKAVPISQPATLVTTFSGHRGDVNALAFSPDGMLLATGSDDGTARLWHVETGDEAAVLKGHRGAVNGVAFLSGGAQAATASSDGTVRIWEVGSGRQSAILRDHEGPVNSVAASLDGGLLVTASDDTTVRLWQTASWVPIAVLKGHDTYVNSAHFAPDSQFLATASFDRTIQIWDVSSFRLLATFRGESSANSAVYSPDGAKILAAYSDETAVIWGSGSGERLSTFNVYGGAVNTAVFSPDGSCVAMASFNKSLDLWALSPIRRLATLEAHQLWLSALAFSPDGARIASASGDDLAKLWQLSEDCLVSSQTHLGRG